MKNNKEFYLDQEGYENYLEMIKNLENNKLLLINELNSITNKNFDDSMKLRMLIKEINIRILNIRNKIRLAKKIESNNNSDTLSVGDVVRIKTYMSDTDVYENVYELTSCENDFSCDITKVSINSPLGRALFGSPVGANVSYELKNEKIRVEIIEKIEVKKKELVKE